MSKFTVPAAGVLMIATGLTGAAHADPINWEAIAACESGGNWAADTGGLQIDPATWEASGGVGLPSQASRAQQIAVAKRIMASRGPGFWPACASRGGMSAAGDGAAPVGSLTHYLMALYDDADGSGAPRD